MNWLSLKKLQIRDMPLANAIQLSSPSSEKTAVSENENNFIQIILTRLNGSLEVKVSSLVERPLGND